MDNITHTLVGLMLSRCGLDRLDGARRGTAAMLMLAANAPDLDAYPFFTSQLDYLEIHRGYTHGLAFMPLMALVPMLLVAGFTRTRPTFGGWIACIVVVLSHLLLDWTNVYGIRMLLPFSDRWMRLDITNVVDPIIWLILLLAVALPALSGLVGSEIGARKTSGVKRGWAWVAMLALLGYEGARWTSHERVLGSLNALLYMDAPAQRVSAFPQGLGLTHWRGLVEGRDFLYEMPVDAAGNFDMREATLAYKGGVVDAVKDTPEFAVFGRFNQVPLWRVAPSDEATRVDLLDLRFGGFAGSGFTATAFVEKDGRVRDVKFGMGAPR